jgi:hypothetical protein
LEDRGVDGRIRLEWIFGDRQGVVEWIQLAQDKDQWRAVVNALVKLRVIAPLSYITQQFKQFNPVLGSVTSTLTTEHNC